MVGDTAVAVNPADDRYRHLIGRKVRLPYIGREIPVIGDETVDMHFGTGVVKVTPGHDYEDYDRGIRHNLPIITAMNLDGTMNEEAKDLAGMDRFDARNELIKVFEGDGTLVKVEPHELVLVVPEPARCGGVGRVSAVEQQPFPVGPSRLGRPEDVQRLVLGERVAEVAEVDLRGQLVR